MDIKYINSLYPDAKNKNPELYMQSLETLISILEEKIEMLESCVTNNEKNMAEHKKLFDEAMKLLEVRRVEMYGDDENDGELIKSFQDGMQQGIQIVKETINEKTH